MEHTTLRDSFAPKGHSSRTAVQAVMKLAEAMLDRKRFEHCVSAARTAAEICRRYGHDEDAAYLAGLAHDLCKQMPAAEQLSLARSFSGPLPLVVFENPRLPHGPAAAAYLEREGLTSDPAVLEAVAYHTVGRAGMGPVALAVYVADKIEPNRRDWAQGVRQHLAAGAFDGPGGLGRLATATLETMLDQITASGRAVAATTLVLYNSLTGKSITEWPVR